MMYSSSSAFFWPVHSPAPEPVLVASSLFTGDPLAFPGVLGVNFAVLDGVVGGCVLGGGDTESEAERLT
jgi:hypothetical protein